MAVLRYSLCFSLLSVILLPIELQLLAFTLLPTYYHSFCQYRALPTMAGHCLSPSGCSKHILCHRLSSATSSRCCSFLQAQALQDLEAVQRDAFEMCPTARLFPSLLQELPLPTCICRGGRAMPPRRQAPARVFFWFPPPRNANLSPRRRGMISTQSKAAITRERCMAQFDDEMTQDKTRQSLCKQLSMHGRAARSARQVRARGNPR